MTLPEPGIVHVATEMEGPSYVQDFLARDTRSALSLARTHMQRRRAVLQTNPGHIDRLPGLTVVRVGSLSRREIFHNIRSRNCYAAGGERILIKARIAGCDVDVTTKWGDPQAPRRITAVVAAESDINLVGIVRNGVELSSRTGCGWQMDIEFTDEESLAGVAFPPGGAFTTPFVYYYLRVTCSSGAQAWPSPVWLTL